MKSFFLPLLLFVGINLFVFNNASAQFEQKFTLQLAGGYVRALAPENFTKVFENGFSIDGGAQYNFSRTTSMVVLVKYSKYFASDSLLGALQAKFNLLGISLCPKYRFNPGGKVNPYVFGGISLNYVSFTLGGGYTTSNTSPASFGVTGGFGVDFGISDNLAFFWQAGANTIKPKGDWLSAIYTQAGFNISLFKSKSL